MIVPAEWPKDRVRGEIKRNGIKSVVQVNDSAIRIRLVNDIKLTKATKKDLENITQFPGMDAYIASKQPAPQHVVTSRPADITPQAEVEVDPEAEPEAEPKGQADGTEVTDDVPLTAETLADLSDDELKDVAQELDVPVLKDMAREKLIEDILAVA